MQLFKISWDYPYNVAKKIYSTVTGHLWKLIERGKISPRNFLFFRLNIHNHVPKEVVDFADIVFYIVVIDYADTISAYSRWQFSHRVGVVVDYYGDIVLFYIQE